MPYPRGHFDLVVMFSVIEHLRSYREALAEIARVTAPDGRLLLGMPAVNLTMELGFRAIGFKGIDDHHVTTPSQVSAALSDCGWSIERRDRLKVMGLTVYYQWLLTRRERR